MELMSLDDEIANETIFDDDTNGNKTRQGNEKYMQLNSAGSYNY